MRPSGIVSMVCALIILVIGAFSLETFRDAGEFKRLEPHFDGSCKAVTGVPSSEDITIHPESGLAFISSDDRRGSVLGEKGQGGAIYGYDLKSPHPQLMNLTEGFPLEFNPHGIGLFVGRDNVTSLFVVNHRRDGHFVEIFDLFGLRLEHRESIEDALMHSPNDVTPVGPRAFYVTNDHGSVSKFGRTLEEYLQLNKSQVLFYDGNTFRIVARGLAYANGINQSHDGRTVYVAATVDGSVYIYDRDINTNNLKFRESIELRTGADNIELDEAGRLWIGCHPRLLTYVKYSKDPDKRSPSQVLMVSIEKNGRHTAKEIYLDDGQIISGSSVGAVFSKKLLVGSVFDPRFLVCEMPE
jgi:arylesterase/paraoxonase